MTLNVKLMFLETNTFGECICLLGKQSNLFNNVLLLDSILINSEKVTKVYGGKTNGTFEFYS